MNMGRQADPMNCSGNEIQGGVVVLRRMAAPANLGATHRTAALLEGFDRFPSHETSNPDQDDDKGGADHPIDVCGALKPLDYLSPAFNSGDSPKDHDRPQLDIDVAQRSMLAGRNNGFTDDMGQIRADDEVHRHAGGVERRPGQKTAADTKKTAQQPHDKTDRDQVSRGDVDASDWKIHPSSRCGMTSVSKKRVSISSKIPWPMMSASAAPA